MTTTKYSSGSPYKATPQTSWYLDNLVLRDIQPDATDTAMVISPKYDMQPYNLSYDLYATSEYWWVFMIMNMDVIRDPIYDFKAGIQIRVPTKSRLISTLSSST